MNNKSHFRFNKQERSGIFFLLLVIIGLQSGYYYSKAKPFDRDPRVVLNTLEQSKLDSLRNSMVNTFKIYPFNPNYISDQKGYAMGMSVEELDRLFAFRKKNRFVNTAKEFQEVTQISDSLLGVMSPFFKFPDWKIRQEPIVSERTVIKSPMGTFHVMDINTATVEDLKEISGIGETLSNRIIKFRDRLGGFLVNEQLYDVYGLEPEVVERTLLRYQVLQVPAVNKIDINMATEVELSKLVYINKELAKHIIIYRNEQGPFSSLDELTNVTTFPKDRIGRIKLYLTL
ncbi:MAG: helix-hairpin-helix domain-containing protein [Muricauda sp.]|nr:helix-hairpin-helix domain-containing protein [Allomuricauda sp.]